MSLAPGTRLGAYQITAPLGAGGMGEVYRAIDTRLGRDVALKLPEAFASDPDRLAASNARQSSWSRSRTPTSPPSSEISGQRVLVMELVAGEDLAARLKRRPIAVDESLAIAKQIAEALEEAHEKGIVHRDLKPANVKLTPDGKGASSPAGTGSSARPSRPEETDPDRSP